MYRSIWIGFPTCVGVNRSDRRPPIRDWRLPHVRGGEPVSVDGRSSLPQGFPTCVGVNREPGLSLSVLTASPRAWG